MKDMPLEVTKFKYLGSLISDEGSKPEITAEIAQTSATIGKLHTIEKTETSTCDVRFG